MINALWLLEFAPSHPQGHSAALSRSPAFEAAAGLGTPYGAINWMLQNTMLLSVKS